MHNGHSHHEAPVISGEHSPKEVVKFIVVILIILGISVILTNFYGPSSLVGWSRWFMGVFFIVFASFKFVGFRMFSMMFAGYDVIAKRFMLYAHLFPFIELGLGLAYIFDIAPDTRDFVTIVIMSISSIGVIQEIRKRSGVHCACLGNVIKLPLSTVSLVEDVGMAAMALLVMVLA